MKTLILYATKYGATEEIARRIANTMPGATIHHLGKGNRPTLNDFDCVIIGSGLMAGMIYKEAKEYVSQNAEALLSKKLGLFLSGIDANRGAEFFGNNFPAELLQAASAAEFLGGIFDPKKVGMLGRFVVKIAAKRSGYADMILNDKIKQFAETLQS